MVHETSSDTQANPAAVSVIGTGAIGTAVTEALLAGGVTVRVWNRTSATSEPLVRRGALAAADPVEAVGSSALTLVCLTDYPAVVEVLAPLAEADLDRSTTHHVVALTTGTPDDAARMAARLREVGVGFIDVGVQTSPEDLGTSRATLLYSGSEPGFAEHRKTLDLLGPSTWIGTNPRAAATWDLTLFGLWYDAQLGLLRAYESIAATGGDVEEFAPAAARQVGHVVDAVGTTAREVASGEYPRGPASIDEHLPVLRQLDAARVDALLGDGGLGAVARRLAALSGTHGALGLTAVLDRRL